MDLPSELLSGENISGTFDLILTDYTLEGRSGIELAGSLRAKFPGVAVIISSGYPIDPVAIPADLQTNTYLLQKPYRSQELIDLVETSLATSCSA